MVKAFNDNKPFNEFTIEQLAGDLLPNATPEQKIATGFVRASMLNTEGGTDPEEQNWVAQVDRAITVGNVFMASTVQCTQCHNHKYDPFTQKQFYQLVAFFNSARFDPNAPRGNGTAGDWTEFKLDLPTPEQATTRDRLNARIAELRATLQADTPTARGQQARWEQTMREAEKDWQAIVPTSAKSTGGSTLTVTADASVVVSGQNPDRDTYVIEGRSPVSGRITALQLEGLPDDSLPRGGPGRDYYGNFILSTMSIDAGTAGATLTRVKIVENPSDSVARSYSYETPKLWRSDLTRDNIRVPMRLLAIPETPIEATPDTIFRVTLDQQSEFAGVGLGRFRMSVTTAADPARLTQVAYDMRPLLTIPVEQRQAFVAKQKLVIAGGFGGGGGGRRGGGPTLTDPLTEPWRNAAVELKPIRDEIASLQKQVADLKIPATLVLTENLEMTHPKTFVRERGAYVAKAEEVAADVPSFLGSLPEGVPPNRLGLARWLVDGKHPLTARVRVNQIWQTIFGRGLVETSEDFGTQGQPPSHPQLLDWLATEFVSTAWDQKALIRMIVLSTTYRQSSHVTPALQERDPKNVLLARGPRFRVEAEMVRDIALTTSGLLTRTLGGPPVMPPQPDGMWNLPFMQPGDRWVTATGPDRYKRGLYVFVRRTVRYPSLTVFDAPSREVTIQKRNRSNTPLQALTTLNDPAFFETAQAMARRVRAEGGATEATRIEYAFRLVTGRRPTANEAANIGTALQEWQTYYAEHQQEAAKIAGSADPQLAAWTMVSNSLLNLDETITKE